MDFLRRVGDAVGDVLANSESEDEEEEEESLAEEREGVEANRNLSEDEDELDEIMSTALHVREQLGFGLLETVACGDSGNDILMLAGDTRCIVVGNAQSDLLHWANERLGTSRDLKERFFLATEHEALCILQGIRSFDW